MDYLCELPTDADRREALSSLPPTLNATYERILNQVNERNKYVKRLVQRALRWIVHARKPMRIDALCEAISIGKGPNVFNPDSIPDPDEILRWCSSLVRKKESKPGSEIELAHFTVKEFLLEIGNDPGGDFVSFQLDARRDDNILGEVCLTYLISDTDKENHSFWTYAVGYWMDHVRPHLTDTNILPLSQRFFDPSRSDRLFAWLRKYCSSILNINIDDRRLTTVSPLHYASMLALPELCTWLIERGCEPNGPSEFGTPIHCALLGDAAVMVDTKGLVSLLFDGWEKEHYYEAQGATVELLLKAGGDPNCHYHHAAKLYSPLHLAVIAFHSEACIKLLERSAVLDDGALKAFARFPSAAYEVIEGLGEVHLRQEDFAHLLAIALQSRFRDDAVKLAQVDILPSKSKELSSADYSMALRSAAEFGLSTVEKLLDIHSLDVNAADKHNGMTALHYAAESGHVDVVNALIGRGADCNFTDYEGMMPIHRSFKGVESSCTALLLQHMSDLEAKDNRGFTLWHFAAQVRSTQGFDSLKAHIINQISSGWPNSNENTLPLRNPLQVNAEEIETVLAKFLNSKSIDGSTPFHIAAETGSLEALRYLFNNGSNPQQTKLDGSTALHCNVSGKEKTLNIQVVSFLLEKGFNPCLKRIDGKTPMHILVSGVKNSYDDFTSREVILRLFAKYEGAATQADGSGSTALHRLCTFSLATQKQHAVWKRKRTWNACAFEILLQHGAKLQVLDRSNRTVLQRLRDSWEKDSLYTYRYHDERMSVYAGMMQIALNHAPTEDANLINFCKDPDLLVLAIRASHDVLIHKLLDQHPDVDKTCHRISNLSPIQAGCYYGCDKILLDRFLASSKAISDPSGLGSTLIQEACKGNSPEAEGILVQLLEAGLDPNGFAKKGETALMIACQVANVALVETLLAWRANPFAVSSWGWSIVHYVCSWDGVAVLPIVDQLHLDWDAKVSSNFDGMWCQDVTPFHMSAALPDHQTLEYMLDNKLFPDINCTTTYGETALFLASCTRRPRNVSLLLLNNADDTISASRYQDDSYCPLHIAALKGFEDVVRAFLDHRCQTQITTSLGLTPELLARRYGQFNVARLLEGDKIAGT